MIVCISSLHPWAVEMEAVRHLANMKNRGHQLVSAAPGASVPGGPFRSSLGARRQSPRARASRQGRQSFFLDSAMKVWRMHAAYRLRSALATMNPVVRELFTLNTAEDPGVANALTRGRAIGDDARMTPTGVPLVATITLRAGVAADFPAICALLQAGGLPLDGLSSDTPFAVVALADGRLVGCAHIERCGSHALLRSVAVDPGLRGSGIGRRLVEAALADAAGRATRTFLLTETAARFFGRLGFRRTPRTRVPSSVRASIEFTSACPASATAMSLEM
jgi:amino-acid N-acetyltransferase